jgi:N utilization substance protein A
MLDIKALKQALEVIESEKRIPRAKIIEAVEASLAAAYKKEYAGREQTIKCLLDLDTGKMDFVQAKLVVDETNAWFPATEDEVKPEDDERPKYNEEKHILMRDAKLIKRDAEVGAEIIFPLESHDDFGRIAAQTAKQVVMQKLREAEKASLSEEFGEKEGTILTGTVQRTEKGIVFIDLGRATAILAQDEQIRGENYHAGDKIRAYLFASDDNIKGLSLKLSRTHPKFLVELFKQECPEIANGVVEIKAVTREPGKRSKIAVMSKDEYIDPIGACVGQRGVRVNQITQELRGERIDIILWSEDAKEFIAAALSPAEVESIELDEEAKQAKVKVAADQFSLAIGKMGQNVRLAARLTGWKIDVITDEVEEKAEASGDASTTPAIEEVKEDIVQDVALDSTDAGAGGGDGGGAGE